jgi:GWxTD domain-containing protein
MKAGGILVAGALALAALAWAQQRETVSKPLTERQKKKRAAQLRKELHSAYDKWLDEDVAWIVTEDERAAFHRLGNDEEREQFIEQFWLRRDPTPDTLENEYKEEHYRRIAYANEHFASGVPGWRTDRGRIYIMHGMPDEIEDHSSGGAYQRPQEEGGGSTSTYPFEKWRYRHLDGIGENIELEFVDPSGSGEFHLTMDPSEKDALLYVPGAGLSQMEQLGLSDKSQRFNQTNGTHLPPAFGGTPESMNEFSRLELYTKALSPPKIKFGDLERESVSSNISFNMLPAKVRVDYFPLTGASVLTYITLQFENKDLQFAAIDGFQKATVNVHGRIATMTGRHVHTFEQTVTVESPGPMLEQFRARKALYQTNVPLAPGIYRLALAARDVTAGTMFHTEYRLDVPRLDAERASTSTLLLADVLEPASPRSIGAEPFMIGGMKVRPRVGEEFHRGERMGIYLKVYNLGGEGTSHRPAGEVEYEVLRRGSNDRVATIRDDFADLPDAGSAAQMTLQKRLSLDDFAPGSYTLRVRIVDTIRNQTLAPSVDFTVM